MCYSTRQTRTGSQLASIFNSTLFLGETDNTEELIYFHAHGFAHPVMWIVPQEDPNKIIAARWGLMPPEKSQGDFAQYFKENPKAYHGLNAQSEKLFGYYSQKYYPLKKRCIIPVDGFFEPHNTNVKVKGRDFKVPFYFKRKNDDPVFLAGLYSTNTDGRNTFSILTRQATEKEDPLFYNIHNKDKEWERRRPVILSDEDVDEWLYDGNTAFDVNSIIADDLWEGELEAYPISRDLNSREVDSNREDIIERVDYEEISIKI